MGKNNRGLIKYPPKRNQPSFISTGRKIAIKAMLDNGMSMFQIQKLEGVSRSVVHRIAHDTRLSELRPELVEQTKKSLSSRFYLLADKAIDKAGHEEKMEAMSSYQLAMIGAVSVDKARLMDGLSTENLAVKAAGEHVINDAKDLIASKNMILKRFKHLMENKEDSQESANNGEVEQ